MSAYEFSLFLHITAVVVGFGATFAESITFPIAMRLGSRHFPYVHRLQIAINTWLALPALLIVLATGLYQVGEGDWSLGDAWISATFAILILLALINVAYFIPEDKRLAEMAERELAAGEGDVEMSAEYSGRAQRTGIMGAIVGLLLIVAIFLMVVKPGA